MMNATMAQEPLNKLKQSQSEHFPMSNINEAFARPESGKARYRIVLDADF